VPRPYPQELRDDVVRVACNREDGVTIERIAADFGVHPMTLTKWLRQADVDEGVKPGKSTGDAGESRELRRRNRLLELENKVLVGRRRICRVHDDRVERDFTAYAPNTLWSATSPSIGPRREALSLCDRRQAALGRLTPIEFEAMTTAPASPAA
jgi:transposase